MDLINASEFSATIVKLPRRLHYEVQRMARAEDITQNDLITKMIEREISRAKNTKWIDDDIEESKLLWGIDVKELTEKLKKKMPLSVDQKAHLAHTLPLKKREKLFLDTFPKDLDEIAMIDELLDRSTEIRKDRKYYNIKKIANNLRIPLTEFGKAYLKGFLKEKDFNKVMEETEYFYIEKESIEEEPIEEEIEPIDEETLDAEIIEPEEE